MKSQENIYDSVFNKREWLSINDTTTQYDQGTSVIETTSHSNNSNFLDYNSGYLSVPLLVTLTSRASAITGIADTGVLPYTKSVGFKQSFLSKINSITVDLNGQPMVQQNQQIDMHNHFRLLTSESWTSRNRWSPIGFYPDVAEVAGFSTAKTKYAPAGQPANNDSLNLGLSERLGYILDDAGRTFDGVVESVLSNLISNTKLSKLYVSHVSNLTAGSSLDAVAGTLGKSPVVQYSVKATIMLKDIHPLFEVMPISKSLNFKIQIFWNKSVVTATHDDSEWTSQSSQYRAYNGTLPLMLNNFDDGFKASPAGTLRASVYVGDTCHDNTQKQ